jgi:hypothetical protein
MVPFKPAQESHGQDALNLTPGMIGKGDPQARTNLPEAPVLSAPVAETIPNGPASRPAGLRQTLPAMSNKARFIFIVCATILMASMASHLVARWIGVANSGAAYRRIGPETGPQVFCAGSSLLQFGLLWPEISKTLGQGMENWGVGGSSPSEWEFSQTLATNSNLMIIGVSVYDLNEYHLANARANIVPVTQTIQDLWHSGMNRQFAKRLLSQYPLAYLRELFPTAGNADAVLTGLRRKLPAKLRAAAAAEERANALVLPKEAVMEFGASTEKLSDWPAAKRLRRLALMRSETLGAHAFGGPKQLALRRMLQRAQANGRNIVVVLPVSPLYAHEFLTPEVTRQFEASLAEVQKNFPEAQIVRLDQLPALQSDELFSDPVHLNGAGRDIATEAFLKALEPPRTPL